MRGIQMAVALVAALAIGLVCVDESFGQRCNVGSNQSQQSSAAAIQNQQVIDTLNQLQSRITQAAAPQRSATATASAGSIAERRALAAPSPAPAASATPSGPVALATSNGSSSAQRRGGPIRRIVDRATPDAVSKTVTRRNGRSITVAAAR